MHALEPIGCQRGALDSSEKRLMCSRSPPSGLYAPFGLASSSTSSRREGQRAGDGRAPAGCICSEQGAGVGAVGERVVVVVRPAWPRDVTVNRTPHSETIGTVDPQSPCLKEAR